MLQFAINIACTSGSFSSSTWSDLYLGNFLITILSVMSGVIHHPRPQAFGLGDTLLRLQKSGFYARHRRQLATNTKNNFT